MKSLIIVLMLLLMSGNALADSVIEGTVTDVICAEMDPFTVGDACVVFSNHDLTGAKLGLVFRDYDWYAMFVNEPDSETDVVGDSFTAKYCEKIYDRNAVNTLRRFKSEYFYLNCEVSGFSWR